METYDFISKSISLDQVKQIIRTAIPPYDPNEFRYSPRVDKDGYVATGDVQMSVTVLRNAARELNITVEIDSSNGLDLALVADAGSDYQVTIAMSPDTVNKLHKDGYFLYGFKAVQSTNKGGQPLTWFKTRGYSASTVVSWAEQYQAYTSTSTIIPNGQITATFSVPIDLNQTLVVDQPGGTGEVQNGGVATAISILSKLTQGYTCGISQLAPGKTDASPMCAFPLHGKNLDVIAPIEKVLLMFATDAVNTGVVIVQSFSPGVLIDLTHSNQRRVSYDIDSGWSWDGGAWAQEIEASTKLAPLLIEEVPVTPTFKRRARVLA